MDGLLDIIDREGLDEPGWLLLLKAEAELDTAALPQEQADHVAATRLNLHRTLRIGRTWQPTAQLAARLLRIDPRQCRGVLKRMVDAGQITQDKQKYGLQ